MRLLLIRHGDPDYERDTLTTMGDREAAELSEYMAKEHIDYIYKSPLGRAQKTAFFTEARIGKEGVTCDWLQEFPGRLNVDAAPWIKKAYPDWKDHHNADPERIFWDMAPAELMKRPELLDPVDWRTSDIATVSDLVGMYDHVTGEFDKLLASHGYRRDGRLYHAEKENKDTIAFFCHFGVSCVLLSHLWNCSPFMTWHVLCMTPSSVTELVTEEREKGEAIFRALRIGDISHLKASDDTPSFAGRFCEVYSDFAERH